nr:transporter substrate-binding domain-containing protein [Paraburkholderia dinghuensis]
MHRQTYVDAAPDVNALFQMLREGEAVVSASGLFYSAERDREFDFSYPMTVAGLREMVRDTHETTSVSPLRSFGELWVSHTTVVPVTMVELLTVIAAHRVCSSTTVS